MPGKKPADACLTMTLIPGDEVTSAAAKDAEAPRALCEQVYTAPGIDTQPGEEDDVDDPEPDRYEEDDKSDEEEDPTRGPEPAGSLPGT